MRVSVTINVIILLTCFISIKCVKILGVFPSAGYSQFILAEKLMGELAKRGHQVTVISPFKPTNVISNYRSIHIPEIREPFKDDNLFEASNLNLISNINLIHSLGLALSEETLKHQEVQKLLHSNEKFDLLIIEQFYDEALTALSNHFQAPFVLFSSIGPSEWTNQLMGNVAPASINPLSHSSFSRHMNFFQRIHNLLGTTYDCLYKHWIVYPKHQELINKYLPNPVKLEDVMYNASLMLLNSHPSVSENAQLVHGMVEIAGFHITQKPLAKELQQLLDNSDEGVIYFSLGTNLRNSDMSEEKIRMFLKVFGQLKQKVLWKSEIDFPNKPNNVIISKWFSQPDILAHPNVQLFITHGGLISTIEAVFYGVPMVGIPIFGDQHMNMARAERSGFAKVLSLQKITEQKLLEAIDDTINNTLYAHEARRMSNLMRDNIAQPMEIAMFWIEYILRNNGYRFKSPVLNLYWYQIYMLDILAFLIVVIILLFLCAKIIIANLKIKRMANGNNNNNMKRKKKKHS